MHRKKWRRRLPLLLQIGAGICAVAAVIRSAAPAGSTTQLVSDAILAAGTLLGIVSSLPHANERATP